MQKMNQISLRKLQFFLIRQKNLHCDENKFEFMPSGKTALILTLEQILKVTELSDHSTQHKKTVLYIN